MKLIMTVSLAILIGLAPIALQAGAPSGLLAGHDNGLGKSNDPGHLEAPAVAPEPETYLLFLLGMAMLAAWSRASRRTRQT